MRISNKVRKNYTYEELQHLIKDLEKKGVLLDASDIWLFVEENDDFDEDEWFDLQDWMREFYTKRGYILGNNGKFLTYGEYAETRIHCENQAWD